MRGKEYKGLFQSSRSQRRVYKSDSLDAAQEGGAVSIQPKPEKGL